uniref:NusB domain-containing protein n=1 Tax=Meloidogyne hapla TaxID=6305 RepID=A0A1I8B1H3_MELHA
MSGSKLCRKSRTRVLCEISQQIKFCYNPLQDDLLVEILERKYKFIFEADESEINSINQIKDQINIISNFYIMEKIIKRYPEFKSNKIMK